MPAGCVIQGNLMQTQTFTDRQACKIRGLMRAVTRPTAISLLSKKYRVEENKLKVDIEKLTKSGKLHGKINKGLFIPTSFSNLQRDTVLTFFCQNQYVEYSLLH